MLDRELLIVTGKGGVGKSAIAAALALQAQRAGLRVLAIAMTDRAGLAAHLGSPPLTPEAHEVRHGLYALAIERPAALIEFLRAQLGLPRVTRLGLLARAFDALASTAPGIREVITMGKVLYEVKRGAWDLVVADAPPTGQIGSHLRAPRTVTELVPRGRIREQSDWMLELLADAERSGLLLVTVAEELPVVETTEALHWLTEEKLVPVLGVVANRVLDPLGVSAGVVGKLEEGAHQQAALLHNALHREQQHWLDQLPPGIRLPYLFGLLTPSEVAARLADAWEQV